MASQLVIHFCVQYKIRPLWQRAADPRRAVQAIALRVFGQILLVIVLGSKIGWRGGELRCHGPAIGGGVARGHVPRGLGLGLAIGENRAAILRAAVIALAVALSRVVIFKKDF